jgi:hypothetical protein
VLPKERSIHYEMECNLARHHYREISTVQHFRISEFPTIDGKSLQKAISGGAFFERA